MASKKIIFCLFFLVVFLGSCKKEEISAADAQKALLVGPDAKGQKWQLILLSIDGVRQDLTFAQQKLYKIYSANANFYNSDGYYGIWDLPEENVLYEFYTFTNGTYTKNEFKIVSLTEDTLVLKYNYNGQVIVTTYKIII